MTLEYDAQVASRDVEVAFEVAEGETVALLGPNGAGKSTVLQVVSGLLRPDRGRVTLDGRVLTECGTSSRDTWVAPHDRRIATLAQEPLLFPHLSVVDNVAFGPRSKGRDRRAARDLALQWLAEVGIEDLADRRPSEVSGGQAQRAAVARALAAEPRLLLLDEPMAALDVAVTPALRQTLRRVLAERTAVVVTHDALDALLLADRVVVLDGGRLVESGPSHDVLSRPRSAFAARIAGLNMLVGTWQEDALVTPDGRHVVGDVEGQPPSDGDAAVAVFPPTAVSVFRTAPGGSPRNSFEVVLAEVEPQHGHVRLRAGDPGSELHADVTPQAVAELDLAPGAPVVFAVKATEVHVYPL